MKVVVENNEYKLVKDNREGYDEEAFQARVTDYFYDYDYIFGDWAYGKLRLKGFYKKDNKKVTKINDISNLDEYIEKNCAYGCRYFLLEKVTKDKK